MTAMNEELPNLAIMASAGTGKTYSLAMRFIRILLMTGIAPSAIAAITFSNKAAGEIFEKIVTRLLDMSGDAKASAQEQADALRLLQTLLSSRERLGISTIDSFFLQIVQTFPLECGIAGKIKLINAEDNRPRIKALLKSLAGADDARRRQLIEYIKLASYGSEERSLVRTMQKFLDQFYTCYMDYPDRELWGYNAPEYRTGSILEAQELMEAGVKFISYLTKGKTDKRLIARFSKLFAAAIVYKNNRSLEKSDKDFIAKLFPNGHDLYKEEPITISYYRKEYVFEGEQADLIRQLVRHLAMLEFQYAQNRTRAVYELMRSFDQTYAAMSRNMGQLTYHDVPCLIRRGDPAYKMQLGERIDAKIDHYMLDEFQDTSNNQWAILEDFVSEAIMNDATDRFRSFFFVGDIKQSIYQWREGNPELFELICRKYQFGRKPEDLNKLQTLSESYRSSVPVIQTVNRVFIPSRLPHRQLICQFHAMQFEEHRSSKTAAAQPGCAMHLHMPEEDPVLKEKLVCRLVRKLNPFRREKPLRVGILVRENKTVLAFADAFRRYAPELPVTIDGEIRPEDCMAFAVYRQLLRHAAHPSDTMALRFLEMLQPGGLDALKAKLFGDRNTNSLSAAIRDSIDTEGIRGWTARFMKVFPDMNRDDRMRMAILERFTMDAETESIDDFLETLSLCRGTESSVQNTVQIMTIHKSKGLDFDVVILPDNGAKSDRNKNIVEARNDSRLAIYKTEHNTEVRWISFLPDKDFIRFFSEFESYQWNANARACYENCCKLYVAMTRARHALYMISDPLPDNTEQQRFSNILEETLHDHELDENALRFTDTLTTQEEENKPVLRYSTGDAFWYLHDPEMAATPEVPEEETPPEQKNVVVRREQSLSKLLTPSLADQVPAGTYHSRFSGSAATDFGTAVHEAFSEFSFYETPEQTENFLQTHEILRPYFAHADIADALRKPDAAEVILRREQPFQATLPGGETINGCFDRIVLKLAEDGSIDSAEILDYKTDRTNDPEVIRERHQAQLALYRTALSILCSIPEEAITCRILALTPGLVLTV